MVAVDGVALGASLSYALRRAGLGAIAAGDVAELLDQLAEAPRALVLSDPFDGIPAERVLAMLRTAGASLPVLIVASEVRNEVLSRAGALAPLEVLREPSPSAARPCRGRPPRAPAMRWLGRCVELATRYREAP